MSKKAITTILVIVLVPVLYILLQQFGVISSVFDDREPNRLIDEKSPYLQQHAYNPVDWYPWGDEAFEKARKEGKPIFLSVGYSTCYWCHVMEREVFENDSIAELMNKYFVNIKVDREERPDVDRIYMTALQAMTGGGGWPMSMFLTPDLKPFYGATYIPPYSTEGSQGFVELINVIDENWTNNRTEIENSGERFTEFMRNYANQTGGNSPLNKNILDLGAEGYKDSFDSSYGGFGAAPKFPRPMNYNFLLQYYKKTGDEKVKDMVLKTLDEMAAGGIYDHLGGGFHRYSVDQYWRVPHFEKMLYDQALISSSYIDAYQLTKSPLYKRTAEETLNYVMKNLTSPDGGFYSAEDAESAIDASKPKEKEEGAYYVWTKNEINNAAGENSAVMDFYFGIEEKSNVPQGSDPHGVFVGKNVLYIAHSVEETAKKFNKSPEEIEKIINETKKKLLDARSKRPKSHLDDKVITSWNGLMISAFSKGYRAFGKPEYLAAAEKSANFILDKLYNSEDGTLLRRYRDGESKFEGHLEDYSYLIQGLLDLYEASFDSKYLETAVKLSGTMVSVFYDKEQGGFYDISGNDKSLLMKTKESYDAAQPSGNSTAIMDLLRIAQYTDNKDLFEKAKNSLTFFSGELTERPSAMPQMLSVLDYYLEKPMQIIITGSKDSPETQRLLKEVDDRYIPNKILILADEIEDKNMIPYLSSIVSGSGETLAYVCENYACKLPTGDPVQLGKLLDNEQ